MQTFKRFTVAVVVAALAGLGFAGCVAMRGDLQKLAANTDAALKARPTAVQVSEAVTAAVKPVAERVTAVEAAQTKTAEAIAATAAEVTKLKTGVATLTEGAAKATAWASKVDAALAKVDTDRQGWDTAAKAVGKDGDVARSLSRLAKQVAGVRKTTAGVTERVGTAEDLLGVDHDVRIVRVTGFPTAKYDEAAKNLTTCAEMTASLKAAVKAEVDGHKAAGYANLVVIAGFADSRHFYDAKGMALADSTVLNVECAKLRAEAVADATGLDKAKATGRGPTAKFGAHELNRRVLVVLKK